MTCASRYVGNGGSHCGLRDVGRGVRVTICGDVTGCVMVRFRTMLLMRYGGALRRVTVRYVDALRCVTLACYGSVLWCVTEVCYGALRCVTVRYGGALRSCVTAVRYGDMLQYVTLMRYGV